MCALAHYLESEGLATTVIALIRQHAETIAPPRALWVPFELGRPVGPPGDAAFQRRVIETALSLLDRTDGAPILEDFPEDAPGEDDNPNWQPPACDSSGDILAEIRSLESLAAKTVARRGYSNAGLTGLPIETVAEYIVRADTADPMPRPSARLAPVQVLRFGSDDLKAWYVEAATSDGVVPSSRQLWGWFWRETVAGKALLDLRSHSLSSDNASRQGIARSLVPEVWQEDDAVIARMIETAST